MDLVSSDFIILDAFKRFTSSNWRDWFYRTRKLFPDHILCLHTAPLDSYGYNVRADLKVQVTKSHVPSFSALAPSPRVWYEFLTWFDHNPNEHYRLPGSPHDTDVPDDGWDIRPIGHYAGWAKPFAHFAKRARHHTLYATPALAESRY